MTPLSWAVWRENIDGSFRQGYGHLRMLPRELRKSRPTTPDERFGAIFHGRVANNLNMVSMALDRLPSSNGLQSYYSEAARSRSTITPWGGTGVRLWILLSCTFARPRLARLRRRASRFWATNIAHLRESECERALAIFEDAIGEMIRGTTAQCVWSTRISLAHERLQSLLERARGSHVEAALLGGYGSSMEVDLGATLREVAHGTRKLETFVEEYGYQGPAAGELSSHTWREDGRPLELILGTYRESADPRDLEERSRKERELAEHQLASECSGIERLRVRIALRTARKLVPLRSLPKAAYMQALDVVRASARVLGTELARQGRLQAPDDILFLGLRELDEIARGSGRSRLDVGPRREKWEESKARTLPSSWTGDPDELPCPQLKPTDVGAVGASPIERRQDGNECRILHGVGVSAGTYTGRARIVHDPARDELLSGEVVVCHTTDPSWTPLFVTAGAVDMYRGSVRSHSGKIARELGRPCIVNTGDG